MSSLLSAILFLGINQGDVAKNLRKYLGMRYNRGKYNSNAKRDFVQHILLTRKMELHFQ